METLTLKDRILMVLEANHAHCLDTEAEREEVCNDLLNELKTTPTTQMYVSPEPARPANELTIHIFLDSAGDFQYGIYKGSPAEAANSDSIDGGACTTTMQNAIDMAAEQAKKLV